MPYWTLDKNKNSIDRFLFVAACTYAPYVSELHHPIGMQYMRDRVCVMCGQLLHMYRPHDHTIETRVHTAVRAMHTRNGDRSIMRHRGRPRRNDSVRRCVY